VYETMWGEKRNILLRFHFHIAKVNAPKCYAILKLLVVLCSER